MSFILTSFWGLHKPKSWLKNFFTVFNVPPQGVNQCLGVNQLLEVTKNRVFNNNHLFSGEKSIKKSKINKKRLKMAQKSILTNFPVHSVPESWLKYTTNVQSNDQMTNLSILRKGCNAKHDFIQIPTIGMLM